jgi:NAD(P)-dependent dehydrogenase (short-subunit alcohol dehydrogenase family)
VRLLTKATAAEYAKQGIRVNSIHPGMIETPMTDNMAAEREALLLERTSMGRKGQPIEIAYGALFLASDESSFMTGSELVIDGGMTSE